MKTVNKPSMSPPGPTGAGVQAGISSHEKIEMDRSKKASPDESGNRQVRKSGKSGWDCY